MSPTRKYLGHVCPSSPKILGTPLKSAHVFKFQRGLGAQCPLSPPLALMSLTRKNLGHVCPSSSKILGTSLKSGRFYITERVGASAPCPPRAPMPFTRTCLGPLCPSFIYILGTSLKSARFHIPEGVWGQVPFAPPGRPCLPPENALVPCAPLVHTSWVRH